MIIRAKRRIGWGTQWNVERVWVELDTKERFVISIYSEFCGAPSVHVCYMKNGWARELPQPNAREWLHDHWDALQEIWPWSHPELWRKP